MSRTVQHRCVKALTVSKSPVAPGQNAVSQRGEVLEPCCSTLCSETYQDKPLLAVRHVMKIHSELFFLNREGLFQPTAEGGHLAGKWYYL